MVRTDIIKQIPPQDWATTPSTVQKLLLTLLPLAAEASELRDRLDSIEHNKRYAMESEESKHRQLIRSYQVLVDKMFADSLNEEEVLKMERLGEEIDSHNAPFYESVFQRLQSIKKATT